MQLGRSKHGFFLASALLAAVGVFGEALHVAVAEHEWCATHGEWMEAGSEQNADDASGSLSSAHQHCTALFRTAVASERQVSQCAEVTWQSPTPCHAFVGHAPRSLLPLTCAPKASPPKA
ncbi:MAG: hypothetical protein ACKVPX_16735 [Myxococcaceae bacterium]